CAQLEVSRSGYYAWAHRPRSARKTKDRELGEVVAAVHAFCIGAPLARLEGRVALSVLLERLDDLRLASEAPWEPCPALHVHGPARLPLLFRPRGD
ncbi:hypothetical protein ACLEPN_20765, partial [Myxococcus sp. 1LA]